MVAKTTDYWRSDLLLDKLKGYFKSVYPDGSLWPMTEASGDFTDVVSGFDLSASGPFRQIRSVIRAEQRAAYFDSFSDTASIVGNSNFSRGLSEKLTMGAWIRPRSHFDTTGHIANIYSSSINIQCTHQADTESLNWFISSDSNYFGSVTTGQIKLNKPNLVFFSVDVTAGDFRIYGNRGAQDDTFDISGLNNLETIDSIQFGARTDDASEYKGNLGPVFFLPGIALSASEMDKLEKLGRGQVV